MLGTILRSRHLHKLMAKTARSAAKVPQPVHLAKWQMDHRENSKQRQQGNKITYTRSHEAQQNVPADAIKSNTRTGKLFSWTKAIHVRTFRGTCTQMNMLSDLSDPLSSNQEKT